VFAASDADFALIFPGAEITERLFAKRADKKTVRGIHGTLFYQLDFKRTVDGGLRGLLLAFRRR
jgi:hypothetical protein